jgi:hypothetical protein
MISLDARYHSYLHTDKCFLIDGKCERVIGYGWTDDDGAYIDGYYVLTNNYKLFIIYKNNSFTKKNGEVVEWLKALVLKTSDVSVGSNPTLSVINIWE